jgi:hypothetical protein
MPNPGFKTGNSTTSGGALAALRFAVLFALLSFDLLGM